MRDEERTLQAPEEATMAETREDATRGTGSATPSPAPSVAPAATRSTSGSPTQSTADPIPRPTPRRRPRSGARRRAGPRTPFSPTEHPWPAPIGSAARIGLVGEVVAAFDPITEADPNAVLLQLLAALGSLLGPRPHLTIGEKRHGLRIWPLVVGSTANGRKGTGASIVFSLLDEVDPTWTLCRRRGIASGEAIVHHIRDDTVRVRRKRTADGEVVETADTILGIADKRLLLLEEEFARVLRLSKRNGATLSATLREAWDHEALMTTSKTHPERATGAHVTVIGHITPEELRREFTSNEISNGFANRFLYAASRRSKDISFPPPLEGAARQRLVAELRVLQEFWAAREEQHAMITIGPETRAHWEALKPRLEREAVAEEEAGHPIGKVITRAPAQVLRLAALYAALEPSAQVAPEHLHAAEEVWRYSVASARWIFEARGKAKEATTTRRRASDPERILQALRHAGPEGLSRAEVHRLFGGRRRPEAIERLREELSAAGRVRTDVHRGARGRARERWRPT